MITHDSITKKLGFDPLSYQYDTGDDWTIDDSIPNPLSKLSIDELNFIIKNTPNEPRYMIGPNKI